VKVSRPVSRKRAYVGRRVVDGGGGGGGGGLVKGAIKLYCRAGGAKEKERGCQIRILRVTATMWTENVSKRVNARCQWWCAKGRYIGSVVGCCAGRTGAQGAKAAGGGRPVTSSVWWARFDGQQAAREAMVAAGLLDVEGGFGERAWQRRAEMRRFQIGFPVVLDWPRCMGRAYGDCCGSR